MLVFTNHRVLLLLSLVWLTASGSTAQDQTLASHDWPQWRGLNRDAVSQETGLLTDWPAEGPSAVWRVPGGSGYSTVAVVGGRAFTMLASGDVEYAVCLDAASGQEIWRTGIGELLVDDDGADGPRATPTVDGGSVYAVGAMGGLYALDAPTGAEHWHVDLRQDYNASMPRYGYSGSPLVEGDLLLIESGGAAGKSILALDKHTGREVWSSQRDMMAYSSPIAFDAAGQRHIVFFTGWAVVALSPEDGRTLWRYEWRTTDNLAKPGRRHPNHGRRQADHSHHRRRARRRRSLARGLQRDRHGPNTGRQLPHSADAGWWPALSAQPERDHLSRPGAQKGDMNHG